MMIIAVEYFNIGIIVQYANNPETGSVMHS